MEKKWINCAKAESIEFRILKTGKNACSYDRNWKAASIQFSSDIYCSVYVMTVQYNYGKRIDVVLSNEMTRFQVQEDVGRITIVVDKKQSTFCVKNVVKQQAIKIKHILQVILSKVKSCSPIKKSTGGSSLGKHQNHSPVPGNKSLSTVQCSDHKTNTSVSPRSIKRQRSSIENNGVDKTRLNPSRFNKFKDFRKAQADARQYRAACDFTIQDTKENISPTLQQSRAASTVIRNSFYGSNSSFLKKMDDASSYHTPSRLERSPKDEASNKNVPIKSSADTVKSLHKDDKSNIENIKEELGVHSIVETSDDESFYDSNPPPLTDEINIRSSTKGGFRNLGNTCYMNSILQSLFGLRPFRSDLLDLAEKIGDLFKPGSIVKALTDLLLSRSAPGSREQSTFLLSIKNRIGSSAKQFQTSAQQDAHEFLRFCLDLIQEEVQEMNGDGDVSSGDKELKESVLKDKFVCPVVQNFSFTVKNEITCNECKVVTHREETLYDLPLEFTHNSEKLQRLLNRWFAEEEIEYLCEKCKHKTASTKKILTGLPRIMMIYLKRYSYNSTIDKSVKLEQSVSIPRYLTFNHFCSEQLQFDWECKDFLPLRDNDEQTPQTPEHVNDDLEDDKENKKISTEDITFEKLLTRSVSTPLKGSTCGGRNNNESFTNMFDSLERSIKQAEDDFSWNQINFDLMSEEDQLSYAIKLSMQDQTKVKHPSTTTTLDVDDVISHSLQHPGGSFLEQDFRDEHLNSWLDYIGEGSPPASEDPTSSFKTCKSQISPRSEEMTPNRKRLGVINRLDEVCALEIPRSSRLSDYHNMDKFLGSCEMWLTDKAGDSSVPQTKYTRRDEDDCDADHVNDNSGHLPHSYRLASIVSHKGGSSKFGHYISDVLTNHQRRQWKSFNDSSVTLMDEVDICSRRATTCYILFYVHK